MKFASLQLTDAVDCVILTLAFVYGPNLQICRYLCIFVLFVAVAALRNVFQNILGLQARNRALRCNRALAWRIVLKINLLTLSKTA